MQQVVVFLKALNIIVLCFKRTLYVYISLNVQITT
jgi:hypothetical protein